MERIELKSSISEKGDRPLELLAPAGTVEAFEAAVANGADAIYIGAPALNARALARNFVMAEIAAMIDYGHRHGVKVYAAMNSLMKEDDISTAAHTLAAFEHLGVDALIVQDLGLYRLAHDHFPKLRLHASTLLTAHNSAAVRQFAGMGFRRVVLAREMTLAEIGAVHQQNPVELEVFVHGAMCFSYSGLCLFSSYQGGKSGLRGRCVQPCRRRYTWSGKGKSGPQGGYLFSMNDLAGIELIPQFRAAGVTSLKLEGRMRSASYVGVVTSAYRMAIDAAPDDAETLAAASERLREAMGRRSTCGYFRQSQPPGIISPQHSGNIGLYLGRVDGCRGKMAQLVLKEPLHCGDRLRLHQEGSGERLAFTLKFMRKDGVEVESAVVGAGISIELPEEARVGDSLYKVDTCERKLEGEGRDHVRPEVFGKKATDSGIRRRAQLVLDALRAEGILSLTIRENQHVAEVVPAGKSSRGGKGGKGAPTVRGLRWWLKLEDLALLRRTLPEYPDRIVVTLTPQTLSQFHRSRRFLEPFLAKLVWALPPIITEDALSFYRRSISELRRNGFYEWQIGHVGQLSLLQGNPSPRNVKGKKKRPARRPQRLVLCGDYTLNILNSLALRCVGDLGLSKAQCSIESDRDNLRALLSSSWKGEAGFPVYGLPPLFIARLKASHFQYERPFLSPKGEGFMLKEAWGQTVAVAESVFSLLGFQGELSGMGVRYGVVDVSLARLRKGDLEQLAQQAAGKGGKPLRVRTSTFNYLGTLR